ncbi:tudor and KH domain-containing protein homolog isoform X2 [Pararge aegeria]|uniref:tudor and KH domain-containing protein homolog isoform X2 n=1 Tax=Pararge aegeria TaxID=116150 RepID=UPI0019D12A9E|nr:tudor and KH domain-containing protein homolog isoform X2 [Pararge aegeria]
MTFANNKLLVPVALGFSLVTVTAFVVYYVFKRDEDSNEKPVRSTKVNVIEVQVPKRIVPALIGRSGSNIKKIEEKSGAIIHFKKFSEKDYDVCIIRGRSSNTQIAESLVHDFIKQQPVVVEDSLLVPGWACGRIIGTGGENINDISHRSGARVKVEGEKGGDLSLQRTISFRGTAEQIKTAKHLVEQCVEQERCRREIEQAKRTPRLAIPSPPTTPPTTPTTDLPEATSSSIEVYVSAVSTPSRFWVQFVGPQVTQLDELVATMTDYYGNKENRANHAIRKLCVGQVVAAVFRHDSRWYRARVDDIRPNEFDATQQVADLYYLDYGDSEYVATHELCELRADLLRLRFQAMECFLAGVEPIGTSKGKDSDGKTPKWSSAAIERFEELAHVARWKPLISRTCAYRKSSVTPNEREREIPGIKLYDVTDDGTIEVAEVLIAEGYAEASNTPRSTPPLTPNTPFGDLSVSRVLGMVGPDSGRAASVPKDHKDDHPEPTDIIKDKIRRSLGSGLEATDKLKSISNFNLSYQDSTPTTPVNESKDFIATERENVENETEDQPKSPVLTKIIDEFKANMNRIDSHHSLDVLGRQN